MHHWDKSAQRCKFSPSSSPCYFDPAIMSSSTIHKLVNPLIAQILHNLWSINEDGWGQAYALLRGTRLHLHYLVFHSRGDSLISILIMKAVRNPYQTGRALFKWCRAHSRRHVWLVSSHMRKFALWRHVHHVPTGLLPFTDLLYPIYGPRYKIKNTILQVNRSII